MSRTHLSIFCCFITLMYSCNTSDNEPKAYFENVGFLNQNELDEFAKNQYEIIHGDLVLDGVNDLSGLSSLRQIDGHLMISYTELENLDGLENLEHIGGILHFQFNEQLSDISALSQIDSLYEDLIIRGNGPKLTDFDLQSLKYIAGDVEIVINEMDNLQGFESLNKIDGNFEISSNINLTAVNAFPNLESINGGTFKISWNPLLFHLDGFSSVTIIKPKFLAATHLVISYNQSLKDYCGLKNVETEVFSIIEDNAYNPTWDEILNRNCRLD